MTAALLIAGMDSVLGFVRSDHKIDKNILQISNGKNFGRGGAPDL